MFFDVYLIVVTKDSMMTVVTISIDRDGLGSDYTSENRCFDLLFGHCHFTGRLSDMFRSLMPSPIQ